MHRLLFLGSITLFVVSLFLPVYAEKPDLQAYWALMAGWMVGANDVPTAVSWFANVTYLLAIIFFIKRKNPKPKAAMIFGILSLVIACTFLAAGKAFVGASETVGKLSVGTAFYAWIGSFVLIILAAFMKSKVATPPVDNQTTVDSVA